MITLEIIEGPHIEWGASGWNHRAYKVRLRRDGKSMTAPWMAGMAIEGPPSAEDVLAALLMDASGYENARDFEDWKNEYGYTDADGTTTPGAGRIYRQVGALTRKLKTFLGEDYDACTTEDAEDAARRLVNA